MSNTPHWENRGISYAACGRRFLSYESARGYARQTANKYGRTVRVMIQTKSHRPCAGWFVVDAIKPTSEERGNE